MNPNVNRLKQQKFFPLPDQKFCIALDDAMGSDGEIVKKARTSYGKDTTKGARQFLLDCYSKRLGKEVIDYININQLDLNVADCTLITFLGGKQTVVTDSQLTLSIAEEQEWDNRVDEDISLLRRLLRDRHTSPFEMCEIIFFVEVPMDCWRQWVRHRTASINEYSTRYMEALDHFQITPADEWRLQSKSNKQGSSGYLDRWSEELCTGAPGMPPMIGSESWSRFVAKYPTPGDYLSAQERWSVNNVKECYKERIRFGIAREQARKDLPLSTMTRAYWKCDLHNIFHFLNLRMDEHAQYEIRAYANCMFNIVSELFPIASQAFKDYRLDAVTFSRMEMECIKNVLASVAEVRKAYISRDVKNPLELLFPEKPHSMTDTEWKDFLKKLRI